MVGNIPDNHLMEVRLFFNSFVSLGLLEDYIKIVVLRDKFNINVYDHDIYYTMCTTFIKYISRERIELF